VQSASDAPALVFGLEVVATPGGLSVGATSVQTVTVEICAGCGSE
jgi:hypothetical protein